MRRSMFKAITFSGLAVLVISGCGSGNSTKSGEKASAEGDAPTVRLVESGFGQDGNYAQGIAVVTADNPASVGEGVTASANFMDAEGRIIATEEQIESFSWPNQQLVLPIWLDLSNSPPNTKVASVDVSVSISNYGTGKVKDRKPLPVMESDEIRPNQYGGFIAAFTFTNDTEQDLTDLRVGVVCYDAAGAIIGGSAVYPNLAPVGKPIRIETTTLTVSGEPKACKAYPNYGF